MSLAPHFAGRLAWRSISTLIVLLLAVPLSCSFESIDVFSDAFGQFGYFQVRPAIICPGESVTASWSVRATKMVVPEPECDGISLLGVCFGRGTGVIGEGVEVVELGVQVFLESSPVDLFAAAPASVPPDETEGSRVVAPATDSTFALTAVIEEVGDFTESRQVEVFDEEVSIPRIETLPWSCDHASGASGWLGPAYEQDELASYRVPIARVRNLSGFDIVLTLIRPGAIPPCDVTTVTLANGESTDAFNGEYYGAWSAVSLLPLIGVDTDCPPSSGLVSGAEEGAPPPDIVIEVTLECLGADAPRPPAPCDP